jgi:glycopeptide antibiotics resistance protein
MAKRLILLIWIALTIFPIAGLGWLYPGLMVHFHRIFQSNAAHVVMHALLFAGLVVILLAAFNLKPGRSSMAASFLAILIVAFLQEWLQAISQEYSSLPGALFDLGVDFLGGVVGYGIYSIFYIRRNGGNISS